jgi:hypothetical protein
VPILTSPCVGSVRCPRPVMALMDGTNATFVGAVGPFNPGPSWEIKGTGDFNGDG